MKEKPIDFTPTDALLNDVGNVSAGDRLELMTWYAVKPNGKWCIASIEGVPMPGYDAEGNPIGEKGDYMEGGDFARKYQEAMNGTTTEGGGY